LPRPTSSLSLHPSPGSVAIPDDQAFASFKAECLCEEGWNVTYNKSGTTVWIQSLDEERSLHKIKCRMVCNDVSAETMYDVLHDTEYRRKWDSSVIETFDIGRLTVNTDVGYYSWKCPKPLRNRDVVTLRSWLPIGKDYIIMNYSVKHSKYPPKKDMVRAISVQTGYMIQHQGPNHCVLTYLAQVDPRGSLPKWVVNKSSLFLAPKAMKKINKACLKYSEWKQRHNKAYKPWLFPEQTTLPIIPLCELSVQRADSLENIDESCLAETGERERDSD
uniref:START domain-containing protein 10 n=1 Tax=Gadus morhua TaxID=8049 RepID=A0A8C5CT84_GADMO